MNGPETEKMSSCGQNSCNMGDIVHGHYQLYGIPIPLSRPRISHTHLWDPQKEHKLVTGITLERQHILDRLFAGPLLLIVEFFFGFPKKMSQKQRSILQQQPYEKKPDLSNLIKYIEDAATQVLYHDDCIITNIKAVKRYDDEPRTLFIIAEECAPTLKKEQNE